MARLVCALECVSLVVDAAVQCARDKEGCLGTTCIQSVDKLLCQLRWAIIVGQGDLARCYAFSDDLLDMLA